jgi:CHAT domain-containing protein/tetratricopeptide (TPR) repeat protein
MLPAIGCAALWLGLVPGAPAQAPDDPAIRAAVERYYKALETEDVDGYLSLWSKAAPRPQPESLKYLFESGDDRFSEIQITRAAMLGGRLRVRVSFQRERTRPSRVPGEPPVVSVMPSRAALAFVREGEDWKVVSEGTPADELAAALVASGSADAREALLAADADLVDVMLVTAMARVASQAAVVRQYARAQELYELVVDLARRTGSAKQEGEALLNLGNALYFQRKMPEALAVYERSLELEEQRADDAAAAAAMAGIATVRYSVAEYTDALRRYRQALAIQERLDDRPSSATTLISTGNVRYLQGDFTGAIRDYSRSRELYRGMFNTDGEARALEGLGRTYSAQGDYAGALTAFAGVLAEGRERNNRSRQGVATQRIGEVHLRLGNIDAARKHFEESRDHFLFVKDAASAGRVWQGLGMTELVANRFELAEQAYARSIAICTAITDSECSAHAVVGLAFAQSAQEKFPEAVVSYRKAIAEFTELRATEAAARAEIGLSQALAGTGQITAAEEAAARARQAAIGLGSDDVLWRALTAEARAVRKGGAAEKALSIARAGAQVVERMHREALDKPATAIPSDAGEVFATLAVLQAATGSPDAAWTSASRMRAIELRAALAVNEREIARGMTAEEREQERAAAADVLSLLAQASRERAQRKPDAARLTALEEQIAAASETRNTWMQQLYERLPDLRIWRGLASIPDEKETLAAIQPGTLLLDFVVDDEDVLVLIASPESEPHVSVYSTAIRRRLLAEQVSTLARPATLRDPLLWRKAAAEIAPLIPAPAMTRLSSASRIVVIPDDVLWRVPVEALPIRSGFLGDRVEVVYAGSAGIFARASQRQLAPVKTMLAVGSPELAPASKDRLQQTAPGWALRRPEDAARETASVAALYGEDAFVLADASASERAFAEKAAAASALHVAAPFRINGASPLFSPILLSAPAARDTRRDDGELEAGELMNLSLDARVAVLSDGAATSMRDGAAATDVVEWAWLAAGVPSVLLARWGTDAAASDALLIEFHRRLREGADPAAALHAARRAVRARPEWAAPYYWAAWMAVGK